MHPKFTKSKADTLSYEASTWDYPSGSSLKKTDGDEISSGYASGDASIIPLCAIK